MFGVIAVQVSLDMGYVKAVLACLESGCLLSESCHVRRNVLWLNTARDSQGGRRFA